MAIRIADRVVFFIFSTPVMYYHVEKQKKPAFMHTSRCEGNIKAGLLSAALRGP